MFGSTIFTLRVIHFINCLSLSSVQFTIAVLYCYDSTSYSVVFNLSFVIGSCQIVRVQLLCLVL